MRVASDQWGIFTRRVGFAVATALTGAVLAAAQSPDSRPIADTAIEDNLLADILAQPLGGHTLEALNLPPEFVVRVRDRMLCDLYRRDIRRIDTPALPPADGRHAASSAPASRPAVRTLRHAPPSGVLARRRAMPAVRPELRGFTADVLGSAVEVQHGALAPPAGLAEEWRAGAEIVARRLAVDGLLSTLAQVIDRVGPQEILRDVPTARSRLAEIGLPVDLLLHFSDGAADVSAEVARRLARGRPGADLEAAISGFSFTYRRQHAFRAADESGRGAIALLRVQAPGQALWEGSGSGDVLDAAEQLLGLTAADGLVSAHARDTAALMARPGGGGLRGGVTLIEEPLPVAQWSQDNGKAGWTCDARGGRQLATLTPRYASQNEDGSVFAPNESFLMAGVAQTGHVVVRSPLVFQGGNLLVVEEGARRVLLLGEAEVYRNTALGLTRRQVEEAFAAEFDVNECLVVASASFHIDLDLLPRVMTDGRVTLFVNDPRAAAFEIIRIGLGALVKAGLIDAAAERDAMGRLAASDMPGFEAALDAMLRPHKVGAEHYGASLAAAFGKAPEVGTANLRRFLTAADIMVCAEPRLIESASSAYTRAYRRALRRLLEVQESMQAALSLSGWKVVSVPGQSAGDDSINYLNGVQEPTRYFAPIYGGLYTELDERATARIQRELGEQISVVPIRSAALQRRAGGLHCVASVYRRHE